MRFLLGLVLIAVARGRRRLRRRGTDGRARRFRSPSRKRSSASRRRSRSPSRRPARSLEALDIVLEQNGKQFPLFSLADQKGAAGQAGRGRQAADQPRDRQAGGARAAVGQRRASSSPPSRKVVYGIRTVSSTARQRLQGAARAAARLGRLDAPLHQPRRLRDGGLPRHARGRDLGRASSATSSIPATRRRARRSRASRSPIPRCASRSSRCCTTRT